MPVEIAELAGGAFGGAIASSVLGPLISQRRERRDVRAEVLRAISDIEQVRWAPASWRDYRAAVITARSAGLVADARRDLLDRYLRLAYVARRASDRSWEECGGEEEAGAGGIDAGLSDLVRSAAELVIDSLWHPYRKRWSCWRGARRLKAQEEQLRGDSGLRLRWSEPIF